MDASEIKAAAGETGGILKAGQDAGGSSAKEPAQLNVKAASKYLGLLSRDRAQVSDGLQRALNSVHSTLNSYIQDPQRIRSAAQASSLEGEGEFSRLSSRVISRDASLSESVAEDLSSKSHLVRSRACAQGGHGRWRGAVQGHRPVALKPHRPPDPGGGA